MKRNIENDIMKEKHLDDASKPRPALNDKLGKILNDIAKSKGRFTSPCSRDYDFGYCGALYDHGFITAEEYAMLNLTISQE